MRFYLIGAGVIGRTHAEAIRKLSLEEGVELKVADPNPQARSSFAELFPEAVVFSDAQEMLSEKAEDDDIVIVGTPPVTHCPLSKLALESGRHVLCEKPLVMNREEAQELLETANKHGRLIGCCSDRFLGLPKMEEVKKIVHSHSLGDIYKVTFVHRSQRSRPGIEYQPESRWFLDRSKCAGGIVMDWGPYDIAVINELLAPVSVKVAAAWTSQPKTQVDPTDIVYDVEGHVGAMLNCRLKDSREVRVHYERASCTHGEPYNRVEIEGTLGAVRWSPYFGSDGVVTTYDEKGEPKSSERLAANESGFKFLDHPVLFFVRKVRGEESPAIVNDQAVFNFSCLQAIYDCDLSGQPQVVELGQPPTVHK
ncbi:Gfo/Idh/MocA family oxidoreductase [Paenibacillus aurantius]|uniref:Gfo/Idh/MocA family oxidoreductase n=1 Tax=Paenibacillus aurantius TaxID=2918900 RepID=A0AA96LCR0_9BACL|nr:Gfo/Idh/MocA family oxidoreductase [Paenibacillus aurantius]WNQ10668.1 Gfo/Idh/MocA family oxidoreductase [Paenibacillus aurantius]